MTTLQSNPLRTIILEDQALFRGFLEAALGNDPLFEVVLSTESVGEAKRALAQGLTVDLGWLDLRLPDGNGLEIAKHLKAQANPARIVMLTGQKDAGAIRECLMLGIEGYFSKEEPLEVFQEAVQAMKAGRNFYSPMTLKTLASLDHADKRFYQLTGREREVLRRTAEGYSVKEIADQLGVASSTVKSHRKALMEKCEARNIADLTRFALRHGLLRQ